MDWINVAAPAVTALGGSWLGAWLALRRFKRERAFEQRLDWYRQSLRAVNRTQRGFELAAVAARRGDPSAARDELRQANDALAETMKFADEAKLFAASSTVESLEKAQQRVAEIDVSEPELSESATADNLERIAEIFREVSSDLAADGRSHLGSESLSS